MQKEILEKGHKKKDKREKTEEKILNVKKKIQKIKEEISNKKILNVKKKDKN